MTSEVVWVITDLGPSSDDGFIVDAELSPHPTTLHDIMNLNISWRL